MIAHASRKFNYILTAAFRAINAVKWPVREMVSISSCINFLSLMCASIDAFNCMRLEESWSNHTEMPDLTEVWPLRSQQYRTIGFGLKKKNPEIGQPALERDILFLLH